MAEPAPYSLMAELEKVRTRERPPVHLWHPENVKDIDMVIHADGSWSHEGTLISRQRLCHLFASVLRREGDDYFLVTPVEKCRIRVEDVPFQVVLLENEGEGDTQVIRFTTNMAETFELDDTRPLRVINDDDESAIYVPVRDDLEGKLNRNVYYQLLELVEPADHDGEVWLGVRSRGTFFPLVRED